MYVCVKSSSGFSRGVFPLVACFAAVWSGSSGVEDRLGLLFDFVFLLPSEPHLLRQSLSQVQGEEDRGRDGGEGRGEGVAQRRTQLSERQKLESEKGNQAGVTANGYKVGGVGGVLHFCGSPTSSSVLIESTQSFFFFLWQICH